MGKSFVDLWLGKSQIGKELPMNLYSRVALAIQSLFGPLAQTAGEKAKLIRRQRIFTEEKLAQTFVLGYAHHPAATIEQLAQTAAECGACVSPQAIDKRFNEQTEAFLKELFTQAVEQQVAADQILAPILERFSSVLLLDSTTIVLPPECKDQYAGCGGKNRSAEAAMKLQVEFDLRSGALSHLQIESGKSPDCASSRQQAVRGKGALRVSDLGYFDTTVFAAMQRRDEYFLSRLNFGTKIALSEEGPAMDAQEWLDHQARGTVERTVWLGAGERLKCRLIAFRVPEEVAAARRRQLRRKIRSERGCEASQARLAWCDWVILVTNVAQEKMRSQEALVLYRARWQIELLFKRWKSQDLVAVLMGSSAVRQMVRVWARLLAAWLMHWLLLSSVWGDPTKSLDKAAKRLREWVSRLIASLSELDQLVGVLEEMARSLAKTCRRTKRKKKPGTFELLNDISKLEFVLS
jgi:hypothetical protein